MFIPPKHFLCVCVQFHFANRPMVNGNGSKAFASVQDIFGGWFTDNGVGWSVIVRSIHALNMKGANAIFDLYIYPYGSRSSLAKQFYSGNLYSLKLTRTWSI